MCHVDGRVSPDLRISIFFKKERKKEKNLHNLRRQVAASGGVKGHCNTSDCTDKETILPLSLAIITITILWEVTRHQIELIPTPKKVDLNPVKNVAVELPRGTPK